MKDLNQKSYGTVLTETNDYFQAQGISILGEGYREIASNPVLFESYVEQLTEGCSADSAATMAQLMSNTNANILRESSITGIQPVASLAMPVIRKLWPKFALKEAIDTEVAKTPRFVITYTAPYMFRAKSDGTEERVYIPAGLKGAELETNFDKVLSKEYTAAEEVTVTAGAAVEKVFDTKVENTPSGIKYQPLDELVIVKAVYDTDKQVKIGKKLGVYGNAVYPFDGGQLIVQFDGANRKVVFAALGKEVKVTVKAGISSEYNEASWDVGFDIKRQDIDIPTGKHLQAPLPIEALNDMMALYQIDGTKETVDLMTNVFAQKLDVEILRFYQNSLASQPSNEAFFGYPDAEAYTFTFDCKPAAGFAGGPKAWREEIKQVIDHAAQKIKNNTYLQSGVFTIIGNPLDIQILANVDWQYRGGQGGNTDGVDVDYSVGTFVGANTYKVVASTNVPVGAIYIVFLPSGSTQMTYKYYPYTFSTELGYTDPNRSRVPSLMQTNRYVLHEFMPAIAAILIQNNDGKGMFAEYTSWKAVTDGVGG